MHKPGFTLLEVLLSTLIASMLAMVLFQVLGQVQKSSLFVDNYIDIHSRAVTCYNRLQKDILGAMIPLLFHEQRAKKKDQQPAQKNQQDNEKPPSSTAQEQAAQSVQASESSPPPVLNHIFYADNSEEGQLQHITFITNNPLRTYWSAQTGKPKPLIARVVYRLEQESDMVKPVRSYRLVRQESSQLSYQQFQAPESSIKSYTLVRGIASCKMSFTEFPEQQKESTQKSGSVKEPESKEPIVSTNWNKEMFLEASPDKEPSKQKAVRWLPDLVTIVIELWDTNYTRTTSFRFSIPLIVDSSVKQQSESTQPERKKPSPANNAQPSAPNNNKGPTPSKNPLMGMRTTSTSTKTSNRRYHVRNV